MSNPTEGEGGPGAGEVTGAPSWTRTAGSAPPFPERPAATTEGGGGSDHSRSAAPAGPPPPTAAPTPPPAAQTTAPSATSPAAERLSPPRVEPARTSASTARHPTVTPHPGTAAPSAATATTKRTRRATLVLSRIDPWSTLKASFVFSCALVIVLVVAVVALYALLSGMGVFTSVDNVLAKTAPGKHIGFPLRDVVLVSVIIGAVDVVLLTALATLGAFVYNLVADLVGGIEVTLSERD